MAHRRDLDPVRIPGANGASNSDGWTLKSAEPEVLLRFLTSGDESQVRAVLRSWVRRAALHIQLDYPLTFGLELPLEHAAFDRVKEDLDKIVLSAIRKLAMEEMEQLSAFPRPPLDPDKLLSSQARSSFGRSADVMIGLAERYPGITAADLVRRTVDVEADLASVFQVTLQRLARTRRGLRDFHGELRREDPVKPRAAKRLLGKLCEAGLLVRFRRPGRIHLFAQPADEETMKMAAAARHRGTGFVLAVLDRSRVGLTFGEVLTEVGFRDARLRRHLSELIRSGLVTLSGAGRSRTYQLASASDAQWVMASVRRDPRLKFRRDAGLFP